MRRLLGILLLACLLSACGGSGAPNTSTAQQTAAPATGSNSVGGTEPTAAAQATPTPDNTIATISPADEGALNDSFATARALGKDPLKATVKESTLYYKVDVPQGGIVTSTLSVDTGSPAPAKLTLYNEKQEYIGDITVAVGKSDQLSHIFGSTTGGTLYMAVQGRSSFSLGAQVADQNDIASGKDAGEDFEKAVSLKAGSFSGLLGGDDKADYYSLDLPKSGGVLSATIQSQGGQGHDFKLTLYNDKQDYIADVSGLASDTEPKALSHVIGSDQGGKWYLLVEGTGGYNLTFQFTAQNDAASGKDAADGFEKAIALKAGSFTGLLGDDDKADYYSVDLPKSGGILSATIQSQGGEGHDFKLTLYNDKQDYIADVSGLAADTEAKALGHILALDQGGKWFLVVEGTGAYTLTFQFTAPNDAGSNKDAPGDQDKALPVNTATFEGLAGGDDKVDAYRIAGSLGHTVKVTRLSGDDLKATIYDANDNYVADASTQNTTPSVEVKDTGTGDYVLLIEASEYSTYRVEVGP